MFIRMFALLLIKLCNYHNYIFTYIVYEACTQMFFYKLSPNTGRDLLHMSSKESTNYLSVAVKTGTHSRTALLLLLKRYLLIRFTLKKHVCRILYPLKSQGTIYEAESLP